MNVKFNTVSFCGIPIKTTGAKPIKKCVQSVICDTVSFQNAKAEKGVLDEYILGLVNKIGELFEAAHSLTKIAAKSCLTVTKIKNGYPNKKIGIPGSRIFEFIKIGPNGEDISINYRIDHKIKKAIIIIDDKQYIINPNGQIAKNPSMRFIGNKNIREKGEVVQYYTQDEIDKLNIENQLYSLRAELEKYISYINSENSKLLQFRERHADSVPGNVDKYKNLIDSVTQKFVFFKTHINKLSERALDKDAFRILNKIKTFRSQNSVLLKHITPDDRSLFLIYSKINKQKAMKIYAMNYNNKTVNESYLIYNNKLAKYFPQKPNDRPKHLDYDFHYYTQEEIDNSKLESYLKIIDKRLDEINANLKRGIEDRRLQNNRNR